MPAWWPAPTSAPSSSKLLFWKKSNQKTFTGYRATLAALTLRLAGGQPLHLSRRLGCARVPGYALQTLSSNQSSLRSGAGIFLFPAAPAALAPTLSRNRSAPRRSRWRQLCRSTGRIYTPTLPPTAVPPVLRARPHTGALNHRLLLPVPRSVNLEGSSPRPQEPFSLYWHCLSERSPAAYTPEEQLTANSPRRGDAAQRQGGH